jgi:formylglycine-generating enzyme required for sulfatase activity
MKMRHPVALAVLVCATLLSSHPALAQFSQQGPKLVGTGAVGNASQGYSVSLSADGNTAIVGGPPVGRAWVWTRSGGVWTQQGTELVGSGGVQPAWLGTSVSLSGDGNTAIVGGVGDNSGAGAAWVWTRSGGVWTQQGTKLVGSGAVGNAGQGYSVSLSADGNTAIVGGNRDNSFAGAAWVWTRSGGVWTQQGTKLVGSGAVGSYARQGNSVSLSADGNTAIVGGNFDNLYAGAAWVWMRSGGVWTQQGTKLVGSGNVGIAYQGFSVSLSGDGNTAIVGGLSADNAGAAWVWTRSGGVWAQQGTVLVGSGAVGSYSQQGYSVSLSGDGNTAIVGGVGDNSGAGAAWVWTRSGGVWTQQGTKLVGSGAVGNAGQGYSVSLSADGNTAVVGGPSDNSSAGAAWVFAAPGTGGQEATVTLAGGVPLTMVRIPAGAFQMGALASERGAGSGEQPQHQVTLTSDYYMGKYLVTQGQWQAVMGSLGAAACGSYGVGASYPVYCVSWNDIRGTGGFIEQLNTYLTSTGQAGAGKFRLPTEAEWERAARGGTQTRFSFGDALECDDACGACPSADPYVWWCGNSGSTSHPVGTKQANPYGLFDMHGNLWEWCEDWYGTYPSSAQVNPTGPTTGSSRVFRGGYWSDYLQSTRSAYRFIYGGPDFRSLVLGFRLSRSLDASDGEPPTLTASLSANPASGTAPLTTTLTATAGGTATGTINYTFWWNCTDAGTSVSTVTAACGDPTNATFGANFDSVNGATQTASTTYATPGTYSAKVIIERGSAPPAEQRTSITATAALPAGLTFTAPASGATLEAGLTSTISWSYSGATPNTEAYLALVEPGGTVTHPIAKTTLGARSFDWWVAGPARSGYKLRMTTNDGSSSDGPSFSLSVPASAFALRVIDVSGATPRPFETGQVWFTWDRFLSTNEQLTVVAPGVARLVNPPYGAGLGWQVRYGSCGTDWKGFPDVSFPDIAFGSKRGSSGTVFIEHALVPDAKTDEKYPFFSATRYPADGVVDALKEAIVFIHGVNGKQGYWNAGDGLPEAMAAKGYEVWEVSYPPLASVRKSGWMLRKAIERIVQLRGLGAKSVHAVVHSMGGLVLRSVLQGQTWDPKGTERTDPPFTLLDKVVFLQSPQHGAHITNGARNESGCTLRLDVAAWSKGIPDTCGAALDLALGSATTWALNSATSLQAFPAAQTLSIAGTRNLAGFVAGLFSVASCDESPNTRGSFDDGCVNDASANLNQVRTDGGMTSPTGFAIAEVEASHVDVTGGAASSKIVQDVAGRIDSFLQLGQIASYVREQTQGVPLLRLRNVGSAPPILKLGNYRLYQNKRPGPKWDDSDGSAVYYLWETDSSDERMDLPPGTYGLSVWKEDFQLSLTKWWWSLVKVKDLGQAITISGGGLVVMQELDWNDFKALVARTNRAPAAVGDSLSFVAMGLTEDAPVQLTVTDPAGKVISESRNDFGTGNFYATGDLNADGIKDIVISLATPAAGRYTIAWTPSAGASPEAAFRIQARQGLRTMDLVTEGFVYQRPFGEVTYDADFGTPAAVSDLAASTGAGDGEVDLTWTDPGTAGLSYDLRYSSTAIADDAGFEAAARIEVPTGATASAHRLKATLPTGGTTWYFRMKVVAANGTASVLSNAASATAGPGGGGGTDITAPTAPQVTYDGPSAPVAGSLHFSWTTTDPEAGIAASRWALGTHVSGTDVVGWTDAGVATTVSIVNAGITGARTYYLTVVSRNGVGLESQPGFSAGVTVPDSCAGDAYEPDGTPAQAKPIGLDAPQQHTLCNGPDYVSFSATVGVTYEVKTYQLQALARTSLVLLDGASYAQLAQAGFDSTDAVEPTSSRFLWTAPATGSYIVGVFSEDGNYGDYRGYRVVVRTYDAAGMKSLVLTMAGDGSGGVWSSPYGLACNASCGGSFANGTVVTLSAVPDAGSTFTGWSGEGCSGTGTCIVTMTQARGATATFAAVRSLPGDCDGDGVITIAELQKVICMYLGTCPTTPGMCGADCNGDGGLSIAELQRAIAAYLGQVNSCS